MYKVYCKVIIISECHADRQTTASCSWPVSAHVKSQYVFCNLYTMVGIEVLKVRIQHRTKEIKGVLKLSSALQSTANFIVYDAKIEETNSNSL